MRVDGRTCYLREQPSLRRDEGEYDGAAGAVRKAASSLCSCRNARAISYTSGGREPIEAYAMKANSSHVASSGELVALSVAGKLWIARERLQGIGQQASGQFARLLRIHNGRRRLSCECGASGRVEREREGVGTHHHVASVVQHLHLLFEQLLLPHVRRLRIHTTHAHTHSLLRLKLEPRCVLVVTSALHCKALRTYQTTLHEGAP
jgi:hypothetical protein